MTEMTLRKAGQVRNAVEKRVRELEREIGTRTDVNIYDPEPLATLAERRDDVLERAGLVDGLDEFVARLRSVIGAANVESGIDELLARRAMLERRRKRLERLTGEKEPAKPDTLVRQLEGRRERGGREQERGLFGRRSVSVDETLRTESLTREDLNRLGGELADARRRLADANEELLRLNLEYTVEVAEEDVEWLRGENVI